MSEPTVCMQANEPQCHCCYRVRELEAECRDRENSEADVRARLADAEAKLARVGALADKWECDEAYACANASECLRCISFQRAVIGIRLALRRQP